ncbi:probable rRNA-processing protein EBP2 [Dysidea avara]|uniref:probable rRNA-processing protein EBP2 n=1 Tax=Dysidea avara TaxID=196820 RepID=UPI0033271D15
MRSFDMDIARVKRIERGNESSSEYDSEESDFDKELQLAFTKGLIKPGLTRVKEPKRAPINNASALQKKLLSLHNGLDWLERFDVTCPVEADDELDVHDDFKREMSFYNQALSSAQLACHKIEQLGVVVKRPDDYFAEMVKTDDHMRKVRENLMRKHKGVESSEQMRKLRSLKKFGKQVKRDILEQRRLEKKETLESIKQYRKSGGAKPGFLREEDDDQFEVSTEKTATTKSQRKPSKKRQYKDKKYGFGGKKDKKNTSRSASDMSSFKAWKHSKVRPKKGKPKRPGKSRRTKQRRQ